MTALMIIKKKSQSLVLDSDKGEGTFLLLILKFLSKNQSTGLITELIIIADIN